MKLLRYFLLCFFLAVMSPAGARADERSTPFAPVADASPILQINPGGHTTSVYQILWTPDGKQLISVGGDKVIRIWDVQSGEIARELRGQIGEGSEGKYFAASLDLEGKTLAVGGIGMINYGGDIRFYALQSGQMTRVLRGHENAISALAFAPDGKTLASASSDKTVRVWNLASGENRVIGRHERGIAEIAWSRDGKFLASASYDGSAQVWDVTNAKPLFAPLKHEAEVYCLAWSPDGKTLITGGDDRKIRLWNAATGKALPIEIPIQADGISSLAISPDGRIFASSSQGFRRRLGAIGDDDHAIRFWSLPSGRLIKSKSPYPTSGLVFSPDGKQLATNGIALLDAESLEGQKFLHGGGVDAMAVAWSPDGKRIAWGNTQTRFSTNDRGDLERSFDVFAISPGPDVAPGDAWGEAWGDAQTEWKGRTLKAVHNARNVIDLVISQGDKEIARFKNGNDNGSDRIRCMTWTPDGNVIAGSDSTLALYDGAGMRLKNFIGHTSVIWKAGISPDGKYLLSGSSDTTLKIWPLYSEGKPGRRWIGMTGEKQKNGWRIGQIIDGSSAQIAGFLLDDVITKLDGEAITSDAQLTTIIQSKKRDQRLLVEIQRADKNLEIPVIVAATANEVEPLLSLWMGQDREWVAWTPQGYYACSPKAERVIGWHLNRGLEKAADFYPAFQFRKQFYRPDIIKLLLSSGSVEKAVALADVGRKQKTDARVVVANIENFAPPKIELFAPVNGSTLREAKVTVRARITDPNNRTIQSVKLLVNGRGSRPIMADGKIIMADGKAIVADGNIITANGKPITADGKPLPDGSWEQSAELLPGENVLSVIAVNDAGAESLPSQITVTYRAREEKPDGYVLAAGVSVYQQTEYSLRYAAKDAEDFVAALKSQENKRFGKVHIRTLTNAKADKASILNGLEWLQKNVGQNDWAVVFLSGHGFSDKGQYFFAPHDIDTELVELTGLSWRDLQDGLRLPGRVLLVLDSCRAGSAGGGQSYNDTLREARDSGILTFASCLPHEVSRESESWNNGAFTKALIEALQGKADSDSNKTITLSEADDYVSKRVIELTEDTQHTTWPRPTGVPSSLALTILK